MRTALGDTAAQDIKAAEEERSIVSERSQSWGELATVALTTCSSSDVQAMCFCADVVDLSASSVGLLRDATY